MKVSFYKDGICLDNNYTKRSPTEELSEGEVLVV